MSLDLELDSTFLLEESDRNPWEAETVDWSLKEKLGYVIGKKRRDNNPLNNTVSQIHAKEPHRKTTDHDIHAHTYEEQYKVDEKKSVLGFMKKWAPFSTRNLGKSVTNMGRIANMGSITGMGDFGNLTDIHKHSRDVEKWIHQQNKSSYGKFYKSFFLVLSFVALCHFAKQAVRRMKYAILVFSLFYVYVTFVKDQSTKESVNLSYVYGSDTKDSF